MEVHQLVNQRVHTYYWGDDYNCATTMLKTLAELFGIDLNPQVIQAATGLHGAGGFGAQCGLVEGSLMFIGILGHARGWDETDIIKKCYDFAAAFTEAFQSLNCALLRPQGFKPDNPPHLCEELTRRAIRFTHQYLERN